MTVYCGVDFHARKQTISYLTIEDAEVQQTELHHEQDDIRGFYAKLRNLGPVIVGFEPGRVAAPQASDWARSGADEAAITARPSGQATRRDVRTAARADAEDRDGGDLVGAKSRARRAGGAIANSSRHWLFDGALFG